jgi:hypothetical protein
MMHGRHAADATVGAKRPAEHAVHADEPVTPANSPSGQSVQTSCPVAAV